MSELVTINNNEAVTTTLAIAEGVGNQHKNIIAMVRQYQNDLEEFGPLAFETRMGAPLPQGGFGKATEFAILNERQATLLLSYMRNTEIIREFKIALVRSFYRMAEELRQRPAEQTIKFTGHFSLDNPPVPVQHWAGIAYVNHASLMLHMDALSGRGPTAPAARAKLFSALRVSNKFRAQLTPEARQNEDLKAELLRDRPLWSDIEYFKRLGLSNTHIARICRCHPSTIRKHVKKMTTLGILAQEALLPMLGDATLHRLEARA